MAEITATLVKELREATNVGMMECKRALQDAEGNKDQAIKLLRERGLAIAGKRAARAANEGAVASEISQGGKLGVMIEVNCETDFVARNEVFQTFVKDLVGKAKAVEDGGLADAAKEDLTAKIAEIGENIIIRRNVKYEVQGNGIIASYIHLGGKVGVLVEVGCEKEATVESDLFRETVKDITLHIAASNPQCITRDEVAADVIEAEREIYAKQVQNKPENIIDKIVNGKLEKFYSQICLVEQGYVKDPSHSVTEWMTGQSKELDDQLVIRRFTRYQVGEEI
jgi:elongation factor Ts